MTTTSHMGITLLEASQAQKEVTVNTALNRLDAVINTGAIDKDLATPPGSPAEGDVYIIAASPSGAWAGQAGKIAFFSQVWQFIPPLEGMTLWVRDEDLLYTYDGASWVPSVRGGRRSLWIPASIMRQSVTGGSAALASIATGTDQPDIVTLNFDPGIKETAQFSIAMPKSWDEGTVTAQFIWSHASTSTNFGVVWSLQGVAVSDDDAMGATFGTAVSVTDTGGTTNDLYISAESAAITLAGSPAENDTVFFRVAREAANGADTLAIDARLHGIRLFYTTNAFND